MVTSFLRRYLPWRRPRTHGAPGVKPWDYWAVAVSGGIALIFFVLAVLGR